MHFGLLTAAVATTLIAGVLLGASHVPSSAQKVTNQPGQSCSDWRAVCTKRGGSATICGNKYKACVKTGCWTEVPQYGSDKWCKLQRR